MSVDVGPLLSEAARLAAQAHDLLTASLVRLDLAEDDLAAPVTEMMTLAYLAAGTADVASELQRRASEFSVAAAVKRMRRHG